MPSLKFSPSPREEKSDGETPPLQRLDAGLGFSMLEMLVSITIIVLLMSAVFPFLFQAQRRFQGNVVVSESNQSARAALEVMTQEIGQAGYNPQFSRNKTSTAAVTTNGQPQCIPITEPGGGSTIVGISPMDWVSVDTGANQELVEVVSTSSAATGPSPDSSNNVPATCSPAPTSPWIEAKFEFNHGPGAFPISSYKMPYGGGVLVALDASGNLITTPDCTSSPAPCALSTDQRLQFFGDINQNGTIYYVVYSLSPMVPAASVTINGTAYTLYDLYRSITLVPFPSFPAPSTYAPSCTTTPTTGCNSQASPMVEKVLYNSANKAGPTGSPIFNFPNSIQVGVSPNQMTVTGTIVITLSVAVNPKSLESSGVQWYTMATQIRPLNLAAAINVNNSNGGLYLPLIPKSLPMAIPTSPPYYP